MAVATMAGCQMQETQPMPVMQQMQPVMQMQPAMLQMQPVPVQAMMQQVPGGPMQPVMLIPVPFQPGAPIAHGLATGPVAGALPCKMPGVAARPATSVAAAKPLLPGFHAGPAAGAARTPPGSASSTRPPSSAASTPRSSALTPRGARGARQEELAAVPAPGSDLGEGQEGALLRALEAGGERRQRALEAMRGSARRLAFDKDGCRLLQLAVELGGHAAAPLARELRGCVEQACKSKHANFVVQKIVEVMPPSLSAFVAEGLRGAAPSVARNCYGCRVLCRLAEHSAAMVAELVEELLPCADKLCRHQYAHYVIESILEHGSPDHRRRVAEAIRADCAANARHKHAGHIVEKALTYCEPEEVQALVDALVPPSADARRRLAKDRCGRHVVMALLRIGARPGAGQRFVAASVEAEFAAVLSRAPAPRRE